MNICLNNKKRGRFNTCLLNYGDGSEECGGAYRGRGSTFPYLHISSYIFIYLHIFLYLYMLPTYLLSINITPLITYISAIKSKAIAYKNNCFYHLYTLPHDLPTTEQIPSKSPSVSPHHLSTLLSLAATQGNLYIISSNPCPNLLLSITSQSRAKAVILS